MEPQHHATTKEALRAQTKDYARIRWVFRCNAAINDEPNECTNREDHAQFLAAKLKEHCSLFAFQLESAPTTGYLHYQGYAEFINKKRKDWILRHIQPFEYVAPAKGTPIQAWKYSTKDESRVAGPWTWGEPRAAENQSKTEDFVKAVKAGMDQDQLWTEFPSFMTRYPNAFLAIRGLQKPVRTEDLEVYVFYGEPGTNKSRMVQELYPNVYTIPFSQKVWLTARGNLAKVICIEDFDGNMTLKQLNRLMDRYPEEVECKGGFLWWMPNIIFITTNVAPHLWYTDDGRQNVKEQIFRRISMCYDFNGFSWPEWEVNRKTPTAMTVQELEQKYAPGLPKPQQDANQRLRHLPPIRVSPYGDRQSPARPSLQLAKTQSTGGKAPKPTPPYTWNNATKKLSVYKPLQQPKFDDQIVIPDTPPDLFEQDKMEADKVTWDEFGPTQPIDDMGNPETIPKGWF